MNIFVSLAEKSTSTSASLRYQSHALSVMYCPRLGRSTSGSSSMGTEVLDLWRRLGFLECPAILMVMDNKRNCDDSVLGLFSVAFCAPVKLCHSELIGIEDAYIPEL